MSDKATLSIQALYSYDPTLFDGMCLPDGVNKQALIEQICFECSDLEVLYPDTDYMKRAISYWSMSNQKAWASMYHALELEYEPLENYDRHEDTTDTVHGVNSGHGVTDLTARATAFDVDAPKVTNKNTTDSSGSNTNDSTLKRGSHVHGNIGVTTSQQMLESELKLRMQYNFNLIIVNSFKENFIILVY